MNYNNLAQRTNFIGSSAALTNVPFFITSISIPNITVAQNEVSGRGGAVLKMAGDTIRYNALSFEMLIDEDLIIYQELYETVIKSVDPEKGVFADFSFPFIVEVLNNKGHSALKFTFNNCRIASLGDIILDTRDSSTEIILSVDAEFDTFTIERIPEVPVKIPGLADIINYPIHYTSLDVDFTEDLSQFLLWGLPKPVLTNISGEVAISCNNTSSESLSGGILQIPLDTRKSSKFTFDVSQGLFQDSSAFLEFGLTIGSGIESTVQGRTGESIVSISLNSDNSGILKINGITNEIENTGSRNTYVIEYDAISEAGKIVYTIYKDSVKILEAQEVKTIHNEMFLYFQGNTQNVSGYIFGINALVT